MEFILLLFPLGYILGSLVTLKLYRQYLEEVKEWERSQNDN